MPRWYKQMSSWHQQYGESVTFLLFPSDEFQQELPTEEIAPFLSGFKLTQGLPLDGSGVHLMDKIEVAVATPRPDPSPRPHSRPCSRPWPKYPAGEWRGCPPGLSARQGEFPGRCGVELRWDLCVRQGGHLRPPLRLQAAQRARRRPRCAGIDSVSVGTLARAISIVLGLGPVATFRGHGARNHAGHTR